MSDSINQAAEKLQHQINERLRNFIPTSRLSWSGLSEAQEIANEMAGDLWDILVLEKLSGEPRYTAHVLRYNGHRSKPEYCEYRPDEY